MALNSLYCADVPLSNYSLIHSEADLSRSSNVMWYDVVVLYPLIGESAIIQIKVIWSLFSDQVWLDQFLNTKFYKVVYRRV